jgi:predicted AAA+ superfamily ATPase
MTEIRWQAKWSGSQIQTIVREQFEAFWRRPPGIERTQLAQVLRAAQSPHAVIVSGLRRVGKSTLLAQAARRLGEDAFYYVSFDDERFLGFAADDANALLSALAEVFGERRAFVLDEVQNIAGWERFARRWMDQGFKLYITGSNAALLSRELGTRLTGRYVPIELFPFSFGEYLAWRGAPVSDATGRTTLEQARLNRELTAYLRSGGIPEPLQFPELPLLRALYDDVLYRDIAARHHVEEIRALRELAFQLISNPAGLVSFNKLKQQLGLGSVTTVKNYVQYLEDSWLVMTANVFDASVKRQQIAPKKVFGIDTGLMNAVGFHASPNTGHLLENLVYLALRRATREVYYYATPAGHEVDFYLPGDRLFVQVAQHLAHPGTYEREVRALREAMTDVKGSRGLILSTDADARAGHGDAGLEIRDLAAWLLE